MNYYIVICQLVAFDGLDVIKMAKTPQGCEGFLWFVFRHLMYWLSQSLSFLPLAVFKACKIYFATLSFLIIIRMCFEQHQYLLKAITSCDPIHLYSFIPFLSMKKKGGFIIIYGMHFRLNEKTISFIRNLFCKIFFFQSRLPGYAFYYY